MPRHRKTIRVLTRCVANAHTDPRERIVEFSTAEGLGGLIHFSTRQSAPGRPRLFITLYRLDKGVTVRADRRRE